MYRLEVMDVCFLNNKTVIEIVKKLLANLRRENYFYGVIIYRAILKLCDVRIIIRKQEFTVTEYFYPKFCSKYFTCPQQSHEVSSIISIFLIRK